MKNRVVSGKETGVRSLEALKRAYSAPAIDIVKPAVERVMFTTSPGVSDNPIDPNGPFDAPKHDLNIEFKDVWEE